MSTIGPRAVLITTAVSFMRPSRFALIAPRVASVSGEWMETVSAPSNSASAEATRR